MKKILLSIVAVVGFNFASTAQTAHLNGQTKLVNPTSRTLLMERNNNDSWLTFHDPGDSWYSMGIDRSNSGALSINSGGTLNSAQFVMKSNGYVGLGKSDPQNRLDVNGTVHSKEVKVDLLNWADFVFKDTYELPTIPEVEAHIKEKGHLKGIPSTKDVQENGIYLGEMNTKLLQKIEELMLYTIQQQKEIDLLKADLEIVRGNQ